MPCHFWRKWVHGVDWEVHNNSERKRRGKNKIKRRNKIKGQKKRLYNACPGLNLRLHIQRYTHKLYLDQADCFFVKTKSISRNTHGTCTGDTRHTHTTWTTIPVYQVPQTCPCTGEADLWRPVQLQRDAFNRAHEVSHHVWAKKTVKTRKLPGEKNQERKEKKREKERLPGLELVFSNSKFHPSYLNQKPVLLFFEE